MGVQTGPPRPAEGERPEASRGGEARGQPRKVASRLVLKNLSDTTVTSTYHRLCSKQDCQCKHAQPVSVTWGAGRTQQQGDRGGRSQKTKGFT